MVSVAKQDNRKQKTRYFAPYWLPAPRMRANSKTERVYKAVRGSPGLDADELAVRLGLSASTVRSALGSLSRGLHGCILPLSFGVPNTYFLAERLLLHLRWGHVDLASKLLDWVIENYSASALSSLIDALNFSIKQLGFTIYAPIPDTQAEEIVQGAVAFLNKLYAQNNHPACAEGHGRSAKVVDGAEVVCLDHYRNTRAMDMLGGNDDEARINGWLLLLAGLRQRRFV